YRECPNNVWTKWHKPEEYKKFPVSEFEQSLGEMGNLVEEVARMLFPDGYLIKKRSKGAQELTKKLMGEHTPIIFQAVFSTADITTETPSDSDLPPNHSPNLANDSGKFLAASDVLKWNAEAKAYDLYEIKMSSAEGEDDDGEFINKNINIDTNTDTDINKNHSPKMANGEQKKVDKKRELQFEYDLAFQTNVAKMCGVNFNKKYLIRLNKKYVRSGELDYKKLFEITDKTEMLNDTFLSVAKTEMESAYEYLSQTSLAVSHCPCYYKGRSSHCTTFSISNPDVPAYSVHDLNRIGNSKKYLGELLAEGIINIEDVPEDDRLKPKQPKTPKRLLSSGQEGGEPPKPKKLNQVRVYKTKKPIVDIASIKSELDSLKYPLYFLDYETYPTAIPPFSGYHPYQHIVFQYSLHILKSRNAELEHKECLILEGNPAEKIVESLRTNIGDTGSIISWYKSFENSRNKELANLVPSQYDFLHNVINRTYDLMDIVDKQYYVHHGFKGSSSIKKIQPVIAPDFSYKELNIQNGTAAIEAYRQISSGELKGKEVDEKRTQMLKYCEYDTLIMYVIWKFFTDLVDDEMNQ
ncbi:MAG: hypothetical protein C0412_18560, partial [Flavobacterium sp.]|nr:hypothetical protein [Flavobacterium sp.]